MQGIFSKWFTSITKKGATKSDSMLPAISTFLDGDQNFLKQEEALALLRSLSPRFEKATEQELALLAEQLGYYKVSLILAGRFLSAQQRVTIAQYLADIEKTGSTLAEPLQIWAKGQSFAHALDFAAAAVIALRGLQSDLLGQPAFTAAGFCAQGVAIPINLIRSALGCDEKQQPTLLRSLNKLYLAGLLKPVDQEPAIVAPLSDIARLLEKDPEGALGKLADAIVELGEPAESSPISPTVWAHTKAVAQWAEQMNLKQAGNLWNAMGNYFFAAGENQQAQTYFERALMQQKRIYGPNHIYVVQVLNNLGRARVKAKNLQGAKTCYEQILTIDEKNYPPNSPRVATDANNLGQVLFDTGDLEGAKTCFQRALAIHESAIGYGPNHPIIAAECLSLGRVFKHLGDLDEAVQYFERALSINEWSYGPQHPSIGESCGQLGKALYAKGDMAKAQAYFERQLMIEENANGKEHASVATTLNNLGVTLQDLGELEQARAYFEQGLSIDEKVFGRDHVTIARDLNNLGCVLRDLGDLDRASEMLKRALAIVDQSKDAQQRDISIYANNLGRVLYGIGDLKGAQECFLRAIAIDKKLYGVESYQVGSSLANLGTVYFELGNRADARPAYEKAFTVLSRSLPKTHPKIITLQRNLDRLNKSEQTTASNSETCEQ